ncbi:MAG: DUF1361 domain-containing protein [Actinobacteria bacterium]|nr:DUF1361 domain-containing protein [Actinomycetota bacterium]
MIVSAVDLTRFDSTRPDGDVPSTRVAVTTSGVGVAIGRFQRCNSWDLITQAGLVAHGTLDWARSPHATSRPSAGRPVAVCAIAPMSAASGGTGCSAKNGSTSAPTSATWPRCNIRVTMETWRRTIDSASDTDTIPASRTASASSGCPRRTSALA